MKNKINIILQIVTLILIIVAAFYDQSAGAIAVFYIAGWCNGIRLTFFDNTSFYQKESKRS